MPAPEIATMKLPFFNRKHDEELHDLELQLLQDLVGESVRRRRDGEIMPRGLMEHLQDGDQGDDRSIETKIDDLRVDNVLARWGRMTPEAFAATVRSDRYAIREQLII